MRLQAPEDQGKEAESSIGERAPPRVNPAPTAGPDGLGTHPASRSGCAAPTCAPPVRQHGGTLRGYLADLQRLCIERCLTENDGNIAATSAELGFSRSRLTQIVLSEPHLRRLAGREER